MAKSLPTQIKRSSTANSVPDANVLAVGELAVNFADRKLYTKNGSNAVITVAQPQWTYTDEFHVDPTNGVDAAGQSGGEGAPWKTITYALSRMANSGQLLVLHEGVYSETVTVSKLNVDIRGTGGGGGLTQCTGNWTFSHASSSVRVQGISWTSAVTIAITGAGSVYFRNCIHAGAITKSGGGYVQIDNCDFGGTGYTVTGAGTTLLQESFLNLPTINNANAVFSSISSAAMVAPNVVRGTALFDSSYVYSAANTSPAITGNANSAVYTYNSHLIAPNQTTARVSLAGFWSINDTQYDRSNSTLTGTNLGTVNYFDALQTQGNITIGGKANLGPVGNVVITGGNAGQILRTDGSGNLTWINQTDATAINNGNSNIVISANSNITMGVAGVANVVTVSNSGVTVTGNIAADNISATGGLSGLDISVTDLYVNGGLVQLGDATNITITGGSNGQVLTTDGNGVVSWANIGNATALVNGNSNVVVAANGNVTVGVAGTANVVTVRANGVAVSNVTATGNISANNANFSNNLVVGNTITTNTVTNGSALVLHSNIEVGIAAGNGYGYSILVQPDALAGSKTVINGLLDTYGNTVFYNDVNVNATLNALGTANLGPVANVKITGGNSGQVLTTNGNGVLSWSNAGDATQITNGNSNVKIDSNGTIMMNVSGPTYGTNVFTVSSNVDGNPGGEGIITLKGLRVDIDSFSGLSVSKSIVAAAIDAYGNVRLMGNANLSVGGRSDLGAIGNVTITGGSNGQVLTTNGSGNLTWASPSGASLSNGTSNIQIASNGNVTISSAGNANVLTVSGSGANVVGTLTTSGLVATGISNLGAVGNVRVTGGNSGQVLSTDGQGNLSWVAPGGTSLANGTSNIVIEQNGDIRFASNGIPDVLRLGASNSSFQGNLTFTTGLVQVNQYLSAANLIAGSANLGNVANLKIFDGNSGQVLKSTGSGNVVWGDVTAEILANGTSNVRIPFTNGPIEFNLGVYNPIANFYDNGANRGFFVLGEISSNSTITAKGNANVVAKNFIGDTFRNGSSNVEITANGNVTISASGAIPATFTVTNIGVNVAGTLSANGNANVGNLGTTGIIATGVSNLGPVGNVKITGGTSGQVLSTDGNGNLSWANDTGGSSIVNGNSNVTVTANGNVTTYVAGNANARFTVTSTGANINGTLNATGNANVGNLGATNIVGTLLTSSQTGITSVGTLTGLTVSGTTNLGAVGNVVITGGSSGQVLSTNGSGGLSWAAAGGSKEYLQVVRSGDQTGVTTGTDLIFNSTGASNGITYDTSTGIATLTAGKTYLLMADCQWSAFNNANGYLVYAWVDSTNAVLSGTGRAVATPVNRNTTETFKSQTMTILSPSVAYNVKVRVTDALGTATMKSGFSSMTIIQI